MLKDSITTTYKKIIKKIVKQINLEEKIIVKDKSIANRILLNDHNECFISLEDHKRNFTNNLNKTQKPSENQNWLIKQVDPWHHKQQTEKVINWFNKIEEKSNHTFIVSNIKDFLPSISKYLLQKPLEFAKIKVTISQEEEKIIYHSKTYLCFKHQETWIKEV